jgi:hypothetical protein
MHVFSFSLFHFAPVFRSDGKVKQQELVAFIDNILLHMFFSCGEHSIDQNWLLLP